MINSPAEAFAAIFLLIVVGSLLLFSATGCHKPPEEASSVGLGFVVEKLFTYEGCSVYRFYDSISPKYFTNCNGQVTWDENCRKGCRESVTIQGKQP